MITQNTRKLPLTNTLDVAKLPLTNILDIIFKCRYRFWIYPKCFVLISLTQSAFTDILDVTKLPHTDILDGIKPSLH
jgi:hypothetical protein